MSGAPSDEIADDYRYSLESLQSPDKYAINNLTVIAKENTEYADAISNVLVEHIKKAPPYSKLPALYVLDSIVKNIGTPYTLFLGNKLYNTFMGAYSSVDASTRRKMDEMLKTWKQPVPGAIDPRPVFQNEITKKIENALIQAKTAALKHEQHNPLAFLNKRPGSAVGAQQYRDTPTPPQAGFQFAPPGQPQYSQQPQIFAQPQQPMYGNNPTPMPYYVQPTPLPNHPGYQLNAQQAASPFQYSPPNQQHMGFAPPQPQGPDINLLNQDIDRLVSRCRHELTGNPHDPQRNSMLQALLGLRSVINTTQVPFEQMVAVRQHVDKLNEVDQREQAQRVAYQAQPVQPPVPQPVAPTPVQQLLNQYQPGPAHPSIPQRVDPHHPSGLGQPPVRSGPTDLASLLANVGQSPAPPAASIASASTAPSTDYKSLLASLTKQGTTPSIVSPPEPVHHNSQPGTAPTNSSLASLLALATAKTPAISPTAVELTSNSLKVPRPQLIKALFTQRPSQCVTCGRRFVSGPEGKAQKDRHMDWHFRTNQRIQDASKGIQNRSWYIGEAEWTRSKDLNEDGETEGVDANGQSATGAGSASAKESYVSVPSDPEANQPCPICQETFETGFNQDIQDWVWLDATKVGNKIYHASCFADVKKGELEARQRTATPDSVLGKRKAEAAVADVSPAKRLASSSA